MRVDDDAGARRARVPRGLTPAEEALEELRAEELPETLLALRSPLLPGRRLDLTLTLTTDGVTRSATETNASSSERRTVWESTGSGFAAGGAVGGDSQPERGQDRREEAKCALAR